MGGTLFFGHLFFDNFFGEHYFGEGFFRRTFGSCIFSRIFFVLFMTFFFQDFVSGLFFTGLVFQIFLRKRDCCFGLHRTQRDWIQLLYNLKRTLGRQTEGVEMTLALARVRSRALVVNRERHFKVSRSMMSQRVHGRDV